jgi:uncharacterized Zn-finger protein
VVDENNDVAIPRWSIEIRDEPISCIWTASAINHPTFTMMMEAEMVSETSGFYPQLTRFVARIYELNTFFEFNSIQILTYLMNYY